MTQDEEKDKKFIDRINSMTPKDIDKISMILTLLGAGEIICRFINEKGMIKNLPLEVAYSCSLISANMIALLSAEKEVTICNLEQKDDYVMGEQNQEGIYRKMKAIIEGLSERLKEYEITGI